MKTLNCTLKLEPEFKLKLKLTIRDASTSGTRSNDAAHKNFTFTVQISQKRFYCQELLNSKSELSSESDAIQTLEFFEYVRLQKIPYYLNSPHFFAFEINNFDIKVSLILLCALRSDMVVKYSVVPLVIQRPELLWFMIYNLERACQTEGCRGEIWDTFVL